MIASSHKPQNDRIAASLGIAARLPSHGVRSHRASRPPYRPTPPRQGQCPSGAAPVLEVSQLRRLRQLEEENQKLKQVVADLTLDHRALKDIAAKNW